MNKKALTIFLLILFSIAFVFIICYSTFKKSSKEETEKGAFITDDNAVCNEDGIIGEFQGIDPNSYGISADVELPDGMFPFNILGCMNDEITSYLVDMNYSGPHILNIMDDSINITPEISSFSLDLENGSYLTYTYDKVSKQTSISVVPSYSTGKIIEEEEDSIDEDIHLKYSIKTLDKSSLSAKQWLLLEKKIFAYLKHNSYNTSIVTVIDHTYIDNNEKISFDCSIDNYPNKLLHLETTKDGNDLNLWEISVKDVE